MTAVAAALAVAIGPAAANGTLVLAGRPAAADAILVATWAVSLIGVAVALGRGRPGLPDLLIICAGVTTGFCTTAVAAAGLPLWQDAFGRSATDGSWAGRWWAYGPAMAVLAVGLAGQVGLGRAIRSVGTPEKSVVPLTRLPADRSIGRLGVLMLGSLTAGAVGTAAGVAAAAWAGQLVLPPSLFIVPVAAGSYVVSRAGCTRLAADPPRRVDQRNPVRYAWVAGWTATLTLALALLPLALTPLLPQLDSAGLTVALAVCTVIGGIVGQLPIDRAFRWTRRRTGPALAQHAAILAAQLASAAAGLVVALVILAQLERFDATPQGVAVAVLVAGFGIPVVDLARTRPPASCVFVLVGVAAAMCAACWLQAEIESRFGSAPWTLLRVISFVAGLAAVGVGAVYLVRFAAELTRNTRGQRDNHAFSALVFAATAAGVVYGILALTG